MKMLRYVTIITVVIAFVILVSCQGNPVVPTGEQPGSVSIQTQSSAAVNAHTLLGFYYIEFNTDTGEAHVFQSRQTQTHVNVAGILNNTGGISLVGHPELNEPQYGSFYFDITLTHPFTKPAFTGFDVKGILITPGTLSIGNLKFADVDEIRMGQPDGFTRWWNPTEFSTPGLFGYNHGNLATAPQTALTANVNPYMQFADIIEPEDWAYEELVSVPLDDDLGRGRFSAGASNTRQYHIYFPLNPGPEVIVGYAVDASWAPPSPNPPTQIPDDFPINANQPEPFFVDFYYSANSLYYDSETMNGGGAMVVEVDVCDWQGLKNGSNKFEVSAVRVYCPGLWDGGLDVPIISETSDLAHYELDLHGIAKPQAAGDYLVVVRVGSSSGETYKQGNANAPESPVSAFYTANLHVTDPACGLDSNNSPETAYNIGYDEFSTGDLCILNDPYDYYRFTVPVGVKMAGTATFIHDAADANNDLFTVVDSHDQTVLTSNSWSGTNTIYFGGIDLIPGDYYFKLAAPFASITFKYLLVTNMGTMDVSPSNPHEITDLDLDCFSTWVDAYSAAGFAAYAAGPAGPRILTTLGMTTKSEVLDFISTQPVVRQLHLYYNEEITNNPAGLDLVDFSDEFNPVHHEDVLVLNGTIRCMAMNNDNLYIIFDDGSHSFIKVYDWYSDPANPALLGSFQLPNTNHIAAGLVDPDGPETVLAVMNAQTVWTYDVEDPSNISVTDNIFMPDNYVNLDMDVSGNYIARSYLNYDDSTLRMSVLKYTGGVLDPWGIYDITGDGGAVAVSGSKAFVQTDTKEITSVQIDSENNFQEVDTITTLGPVYDIDARNINMCVAEGPAGVSLWDISTGEISLIDRTISLSSPVGGAAYLTWYYFIEASYGYGALKVIQATDPEALYVVQEVSLDGQPSCISLHWPILLIGSFADSKVWVFDISNNSQPPQLVYTKTFNAHVTSVEIASIAGYAALDNSILKVLNFTDFPTVTQAADVTLPENLYNLQYDRYVLYGSNPDKVIMYDAEGELTMGFIDEYAYGGPYDIKDLEKYGYSLFLCTTDTMENCGFYNAWEPTGSIGYPLPYAPDNQYIDIQGSFGYFGSMNHSPVIMQLYPEESPSVYSDPFGPKWPAPIRDIMAADDLFFIMHDVLGLRVFKLY